MGKAKRNGNVQDFIVFISGNAAVNFRIVAAFVKWCVLAQKTEKIVSFGKVFFYPVEQLDGILFAARENHMPDDNSFL